jgi:hypothetical protein
VDAGAAIEAHERLPTVVRAGCDSAHIARCGRLLLVVGTAEAVVDALVA